MLPKVGFTQDVLHYPTNLEYYKYLKEKWNVSIQAMIYRAHQLSVITTNQYQYQYLIQQMLESGTLNSGEKKRPNIIQFKAIGKKCIIKSNGGEVGGKSH